MGTMEALAEQPVQNEQQNQLNRELRIRTDTITWLAETLNGNMRTSFEFSFDGQELYGEDGGSLTEIFDDSIQAAEVVAKENSSLMFELRRRIIERGELEDMKAMGNGELLTDDGEPANTIIVISDFPPELMNSSEDVGGYNTNRKQTMMRVITQQGEIIKVTTQSLDGSNRPALEAIYAGLGKQPEDGELLSQRINLNLSPERQATITDSLTKTYDDSLRHQKGGEWYAGRRPADDRNTYDFARSQHDIVDLFTAEMMADPVAAEKLRFKLAATARDRHKRFIAGGDKAEPVLGTVAEGALISVSGVVGGQTLQMEMERAAQRAASRGDTFSGCGSSVSAEQEDDPDSLSATSQLSALGYGNKFRGGSDRYGSLSFKCQNGHENTRPRNKLIDCCKTCGINVKC